MTLPTLYHRSKTGVLCYWKVWVQGHDIHTEYGQVDGLPLHAVKTATPKNVGRSNATTATEQAELEARAMHRHKLERKYSLTPDEAKEPLLLPMLAHDIWKHQKKVEFPGYLQPKLDGLRCLAIVEDGDVRLLSRAGKPFELPHIADAVRRMVGTTRGEHIFDGELYAAAFDFQTITSLVKRPRDESRRVHLWIYDYVNNLEHGPEVEFAVRWAAFQALFDVRQPLRRVDTYPVESMDELLSTTTKLTDHGFEGAIYRNPTMTYQFGYRSHGLLKVKSFQDEEFKVVGVISGVGKFADAAIWTCELRAGGPTFQVVATGSMEERRQQLQQSSSYIGQWLKVKFFEKTRDGLPRFPVGIGFRMAEDRGIEP